MVMLHTRLSSYLSSFMLMEGVLERGRRSFNGQQPHSHKLNKLTKSAVIKCDHYMGVVTCAAAVVDVQCK